MRTPAIIARIGAATILAATLLALAPPASSAAASIVSLDPARGPVGATIAIGGAGFTGASAVRVGGASAGFTVESDDRITASVPAGAVTGPVEVDTADGTVASTDPFVVLPNIVLVMTDDQRWDTLPYMATVTNGILDRGVTFTNTFATNPLCCPSRVTFLTGRYSHDTGVWTDVGPYGGFSSFVGDANTIATTLDAAGYDTALIGKYLNGYRVTDGAYVPPGWDRWRAFATNASYYDYALSLDGTGTEAHGSLPKDYSTDVLADDAVAFIETASPQDPLFLWFAPFGPHAPSTPAPRDAGSLAGIAPWRPPSYDEHDVSDKPAYMAALPRLRPAARARLDAFRQQQLEALLSIDEAVARLGQALVDTGRLGDTIVVFTSDNGGLHVPEGGHARITHNRPFRAGKGFLYEGGLRVPLIVRWLGKVPAGQVMDRPVVNTDWLPTLLELAGLPVPSDLDGVSFAGLLTGQSREEARRLFWHFPHYTNQGSRPAGAVREGDWKFIEDYEDGRIELYNLARDLAEVHDLSAQEPERVGRLREALEAWRQAAGAQTNTPNPHFQADLGRPLYVDFDASRFDPSAADGALWERIQIWRKAMNAVLSTARKP